MFICLQVGANIWALQKDTGFVEEHGKRQNHEQNKVSELLKVPRYADLLEDDCPSEDEQELSRSRSALVKSRAGWRKEMATWVQKAQEQSNQSDEDDELQNITYGRQRSKWLPRSLELLFSGRTESDINEQRKRTCRRQAYTEEA